MQTSNSSSHGPRHAALAKCIKSMLLASGNRPPHLPNRIATCTSAGAGTSSVEVFLHRKSQDRIALQVMRQSTTDSKIIQNIPIIPNKNPRLMGELELSIAAFFKPEALIKKIRASLVDDEAKAFFDKALEVEV